MIRDEENKKNANIKLRWQHAHNALVQPKRAIDADERPANTRHSALLTRRFGSAIVLIPDAGKGAFAARALKRGDTVGDYTIATLAQTEVEFLETYPDKRATHTAKIDDTYYTALGTGKRTHNAIGMANRAPKGRRNNARILASGRVVASKRIPKDSEIFLAYGSSYRI